MLVGTLIPIGSRFGAGATTGDRPSGGPPRLPPGCVDLSTGTPPKWQAGFITSRASPHTTDPRVRGTGVDMVKFIGWISSIAGVLLAALSLVMVLFYSPLLGPAIEMQMVYQWSIVFLFAVLFMGWGLAKLVSP